MATTGSDRKLGRRPGESGARDDILTAARTQFSEHGFAVSVRSIARAAAVDPALVIHYFKTKDDLFVAAMDWPFDFDQAVAHVVEGPRSGMGLRLAEFFISIWSHPEQREPVVGLLRAATTNPQAAALLRDALGCRLFGGIAAHLGDPDAELRVALCAAQLVGLGITRYIVGIEPLASMPPEEAARAIAPTLQRYLTGPPPSR